jgi:hypothetical protein
LTGVVELEGAKQRTLFAALALRAPGPVSVDELVEALWGEEPPGHGVQALQQQVSRLRRRLGSAVELRRDGAGYALGLDRDAIDVHRFEELLRRGRVALAADRPESARDDFEAALTLWRGPALADLRFEPFAQPEIARLEELRMEAIEERVAAELAGGRGTDLGDPIVCSVTSPFRPLGERAPRPPRLLESLEWETGGARGARDDDPREPTRVLAFDADHDSHRRRRIALLLLEGALIEQRELSV